MGKPSSSSCPIGVFDSGLGGLTVARALLHRLPNEQIVYLGDNARVPYGTRSAGTVERYAKNCARFLLNQGLKLLVVACNTVSAVAIPALRKMTDIPVLGVIEAGAGAVFRHGAGRVGVIGTTGTISSGAYPAKICEKRPACEVIQKATPLFVPLAEEGWIHGEVPLAVAKHYLGSLVDADIELLLLGCTHYPLLIEPISQVLSDLGSRAQVVDSATAMADSVVHLLDEKELHQTAPADLTSRLTCFVTDIPQRFEAEAGRFLGHALGSVTQIDIT